MTRQLASIRSLLLAARDDVKADVTVELWDGSHVEFSRSNAENVHVYIGSAAAVRTILLQPTVATLFGLFGRGDIGISKGSPLQLLRAFDHISIKTFFKSHSRVEMLKLAATFILAGSDWGNVRAFLRRQTGSARNDQQMIQFHYDVSNAFYQTFLDDTMVYTCAYFRDWGNSIAEAQFDKLDHVCRKLRLKPGESMLDIGCGWGGLAMHAAEHYGVTVKGVTLSKDQYELAVETARAKGLSDRVSFELKDFRHLTGKNLYDKISAIGIFEHIGVENHDTYFTKIHEMLKPRGLLLHHAITRRASKDLSRFDRQSGYQQAITRYIFPGGELDHIGRTITNLERFGFEVHDAENLREHYALTCQLWHDRLWDNRAAAEALVGPEVVRLWLLYLALSVISFDRGVTYLFQTLASKRRTGPTLLPPTRDDIYRR